MSDFTTMTQTSMNKRRRTNIEASDALEDEGDQWTRLFSLPIVTTAVPPPSYSSFQPIQNSNDLQAPESLEWLSMLLNNTDDANGDDAHNNDNIIQVKEDDENLGFNIGCTVRIKRNKIEQPTTKCEVNPLLTANKALGQTDLYYPSGVSVPMTVASDRDQRVSDWALEEDEILFGLHAKHGNNWALISNSLPNKNRVQVKTRFRSLCRAAKRFWTREQDQKLLEIHSEYGHLWEDAVANHFPNKTKNSIRNRLRDLTDLDSIHDKYPNGSPSAFLASRPEAVKSLLTSYPSYQSILSSNDGNDGGNESEAYNNNDSTTGTNDNKSESNIYRGRNGTSNYDTICPCNSSPSNSPIYSTGNDSCCYNISPANDKISLINRAISPVDVNKVVEDTKLRRPESDMIYTCLDGVGLMFPQSSTIKYPCKKRDNKRNAWQIGENKRKSNPIILNDKEIDALMNGL